MTTTHHGALRARATRADRGQALALLSLFLIAMSGLVGLGVDGGSLYLTRRGMQNAADAAALAGARVMATGDTSGADIRTAIETYAGANYVANPAQNVTAYYTDGTGARVGTVTASGSAPASAIGVEVIATRQAATIFLPILGINSLEAKAIAGARAKPAAGGGPGYGIFAIDPNQPKNSKVINWPGSSWTVSGTVHSNSDVSMSGSSNTINGSVEDVTGANPTGLKSATLNPSKNNPVQSTVLPDPVNKTPSDFYQGTTSTATYHYVSGDTNLSSYMTNGVLQSGTYYVNGNINFATTMSQTVTSAVTLVATGSINISSANMNFNFAPYTGGMLFFANTSNSNGLTIAGSSGSWTGLAYAPHTNLQYSGSANVSGAGSLVGWHITMAGSSGHLTYDPSIFPAPSTAEITLYE
jgi:hypothetical protein